MRKKELALCCLLISSTAGAGTEREKVIYGVDNRMDAPLHANKALRAISPAVAARIPKSDMVERNGIFSLPSTTLRSSMGVCTTERFSTQRTAAECTGFLVGPDILVTAGHCMQNMADCQEHYWGFDFLYTTRALAKDQVFECSSIISRELSATNDYAIIRLNKVALGRTPLKIRKAGSISSTDNLAVLGHPSGLPLKIADGGIVRAVNPTKKFFTADLDTYGGNSGSPVVNTTTLEGEGILVRGENDYVYDNSKRCYKSNVCAMGACRGEDVTKITSLPKVI